MRAALHELGHATGHETRLHRREVMSTEGLGPTDIGREELVADFTASYLCAEAGIAPATVENQAAYIENWTRVLKGQPPRLGGGGRRRAPGGRLHPRPATGRRRR